MWAIVNFNKIEWTTESIEKQRNKIYKNIEIWNLSFVKNVRIYEI